MDRYAVMGNPIAHSKSPMIHALFAQQTNQALEYSAILVEPGRFKQAVHGFRDSGGKGLNVTVPFKIEAWELADSLSELAEHAGAVNTLQFRADGTIYGTNTDGIGIVRDIQQNHQMDISGKTVLLIGAGGAVRGVLGPILDRGPRQVVIANRTASKAEELADLFSTQGNNIEGCGFDTLARHSFDIVINGTAASLKGEVPAISPEAVNDAFCYDMMYGAKPTAFLQWASANGAAGVVDGLGMLVEQAAESFYIWRNVRPETQSIIQKVRASIS